LEKGKRGQGESDFQTLLQGAGLREEANQGIGRYVSEERDEIVGSGFGPVLQGLQKDSVQGTVESGFEKLGKWSGRG
jgi:hypothetical protein